MKNQISHDIQRYIASLEENDKELCELLARLISFWLPHAENKIWHAHPVWFLDGNPITGFNKEKAGIRLMFWSGADFQEEQLNILGSKFKDASIYYHSADGINPIDLKRWLEKSIKIQWDYKNLVKRKGELIRLT